MPEKSWIVVQRPRTRWDSAGVHLPLVLLTGAMMLASAILPADGLPGPQCMFLRLTGYPCPFCGSTRAFVAMGHARWHDAWHQSPLASVAFAVTVAVFLWNATAIATGLLIKPGKRSELNRNKRLAITAVVTAAVLSNWFYRIATGLR